MNKFFTFFLIFSFNSAFALQEVKVALDWFLNPHHAPFIIAEKNGYFKEEGLQLTLIPTQSSHEGCRLVLSGVVDFALTNEPQLVAFTLKKLALIPVAYLIDHTLEVIVSHEPLTPHTIKNKRIGHASSSSYSMTLKMIDTFLKKFNLQTTDVEIVLLKNGLANQFLSHHLDIIFNIYKTYELYDIKRFCPDCYVYELKEFGIENFASLIVVTSCNTSKELNEKVQRALQKAINFIKNTPIEARKIVLNYRPELNTPSNAHICDEIFSHFINDIARAF